MQPATLLPNEQSACSLLVCSDDRPLARGVSVRRGLLAEGRLTSVHIGRIQQELREVPKGLLRLAPDNPFLTAEQIGKLDPRGIVLAETRLGPDDVLISVVRVHHDTQAVPGLQAVADESVRTPASWSGAVVASVEHRTRKQLGRGAPPGVLELVEVQLRLEQPLAGGDRLFVRDANAGEQLLGIVAEFLPDEQMPRDGERVADLVISSQQMPHLGPGIQELNVGKDNDVAAFQTFASAGSERSLISRQPFADREADGIKTPHPRQPAVLTVGHIGWLRERGLNALAAEFVATKSDDLNVQLAQRKPNFELAALPAPSTPASLYVLASELWALGFVPEFSSGEPTSLTIRPASRAELLARSSGEINKPETIHYRSLKPERHGIMCPLVYGEDWELHRFAHFELGCGVIPYWWRIGKPSLLEELLQIKARQLEKLVDYQLHIRKTADGYEWREFKDQESISEDWLTGAPAVVELLSAIPPERLPAGLRGQPQNIVQDVVLLPPVWTRPLVQLDDGNFATSDLNDHYRRIVNRANRLRKLVDLKAPPVIIRNERRELQEGIDALQANQMLPRRRAIMGDGNRPLVDVATMCVGSLLMDSKKVDWSGQARGVIDSSLSDESVEVPQSIFTALGLRADEPVLLTTAAGPAFYAARPHAGEGHVIRLSPLAWERLAARATDDGLIQVHRPLRAAARQEASQLNLAEPKKTFAIDPLFQVADAAAGLAELARAAIQQRTIAFDSAAGVLLAGVGPVEFLVESLAGPPPKPPTQAVPIPPPRDVREVTPEAIDQAIQSLRRPVWLIKTTETNENLPPQAGALVGDPVCRPTCLGLRMVTSRCSSWRNCRSIASGAFRLVRFSPSFAPIGWPPKGATTAAIVYSSCGATTLPSANLLRPIWTLHSRQSCSKKVARFPIGQLWSRL